MPLDFVEHASPNFDLRKSDIDMLVVHYTGMRTAEESLARLCDGSIENRVSAHYLIEEDGRIHRLVQEADRAWHAGVSYWAGERDINSCSIGIELQNPGWEFDYHPFPEPQMAAFLALAKDIIARHRISPFRVLGHSDVAPTRKADPGELFDWECCSRDGVGFWPTLAPGSRPEVPLFLPLEAGGASVEAAQEALNFIGYECDVNGRFDAKTLMVISAFQRHWRPARVDGTLDADTIARLQAVAQAVEVMDNRRAGT
ncbi:MAG: N-acetylmuramoyl-L-alanine amidase [Gemmatimonas sp.]